MDGGAEGERGGWRVVVRGGAVSGECVADGRVVWRGVGFRLKVLGSNIKVLGSIPDGTPSHGAAPPCVLRRPVADDDGALRS